MSERVIEVVVPTGEPWDIEVRHGADHNSIVADIKIPAERFIVRFNTGEEECGPSK